MSSDDLSRDQNDDTACENDLPDVYTGPIPRRDQAPAPVVRGAPSAARLGQFNGDCPLSVKPRRVAVDL